MISEEKTDSESKQINKVISTYKNNFKIEQTTSNNTLNRPERITYEYDDFGNMTMERDSISMIYIGGSRIFYIDPNNKNFKIYRCQYNNFDSYNNWLRQDMLQ